MTADTTGTRLVDTDALLADLAAWWGDQPLPPALDREPDDYTTAVAAVLGGNHEARRIAGSEFDQQIPEGVQNPYWEIIRQLPLDPIPLPWHYRPEPMLHWYQPDFRVFADRFAMCGTYSWAICSPGDITWLKDVLSGRGVVEPGAGTGYWAWQMEQAGIDVAAYHSAPKHHPDRALFLCWPSYAEPWAAQSLACYTGDLLIYCGEGQGGCTADDAFFGLLDAEWEEISDSPAHIAHWGVHDYLTAYRRKS